MTNMNGTVWVLLILGLALVVAFVTFSSDEGGSMLETPRPARTEGETPDMPRRPSRAEVDAARLEPDAADAGKLALEAAPKDESGRARFVVIDAQGVAERQPWIEVQGPKGRKLRERGDRFLSSAGGSFLGPFDIPVSVGDLVRFEYARGACSAEVKGIHDYEVRLIPKIRVTLRLEDEGPDGGLRADFIVSVIAEDGRPSLDRVVVQAQSSTVLELMPARYRITLEQGVLKVTGDRVRTFSDSHDVQIRDGEFLDLREGVLEATHVLRYVLPDLCEVTVEGLGGRTAIVFGPIEDLVSLGKAEERLSNSKVAARFSLESGSYFVFTAEDKLLRRCRFRIREGERTRTLNYLPLPVVGVACLAIEGDQGGVPELTTLCAGDVIRGLNGMRLGEDISFQDYALTLVSTYAQGGSVRLIVERGKGESFVIELQPREAQALTHKIAFLPVTE